MKIDVKKKNRIGQDDNKNLGSGKKANKKPL